MIDPKRYEELKRTDRLPSPRGAALRVMELCRQDNAALAEIVRTLNADPALAGQVIKMANSAVYGRQRPVVALSPEVILSIGIQTLRQVVLAFALISAYRIGECRDFDYEAFWSRSAATALAAGNLGGLAPVAPHAELFTCGLLAGVGRLALATVYPEAYSDILARSQGYDDPALCDRERQSFALDHRELASAMLGDWGIPKLFCDTLLCHEAPESCAYPEGSRPYRLAYLLHLAAHLAESCFLAEHERSAHLPRLFKTAEKIGIAPEQLVRLGDRMLEEWRDWAALLRLVVRDVEPFSALEAFADDGADDFADPVLAQGIRVLIADADAALRLLLGKKLASLGYEVLTAGTASEALEQVAAHAPQMILSDVLLPETGGIELCRTLRRGGGRGAVYFILLTAHKEQGHLVAAFQAGADDFISKPLALPILLGRLAVATRIVRLQQMLEAERSDARAREAGALKTSAVLAAEWLDVASGCPNGRYAMARLGGQWTLAEHSGVPFCCLRVSLGLTDVQPGHDRLRDFAALLHATSRAEDVVCCIAAGEFLIISPHAVLAAAVQHGERLLARVAQAFFSWGGGETASVSIGVAAKGAGVTDTQQLLRLAESALARAREQGCGLVSAKPDPTNADQVEFQPA